MATTVFIIYYGWIHINDLVIGYAAFAVFHDIQYFAIVWVYNNNLVKRQEPDYQAPAYLLHYAHLANTWSRTCWSALLTAAST